ncbi:unnamed protein product [Phyllotreta striolata]|uniref:Uncharacterized protein n=1 Tax=Phyllotreta striolata TaxID=444603 RepID=A0A9P0DQ18_PHYSR|nr:unnamed protein product [Phyllotreta striolata]
MNRLLVTVGVLIGFLVLVWGFEIFGKKERILQIKKLENCKVKRNWPMSWENFKITTRKDTKENFMNLDLIVKEEVSMDFSMSFSFLKCDTSGNPDSCEFLFRDTKINNVCKYLAMKDQSWSQFVECFNKELKCPMKPVGFPIIALV